MDAASHVPELVNRAEDNDNNGSQKIVMQGLRAWLHELRAQAADPKSSNYGPERSGAKSISG